MANKPASQEEGQQHFKKYQEWLTSLGNDLVSAMNPIKNIHTISPDGQSKKDNISQLSGYTIIKADSMEDALVMAKACPFLDIQGTLQLAELIQMPS